jgi:hypothetical protein
MCTIGYHKDLGLILKNRDKTSTITEEIIHNDRFIACRSSGADYCSWGMNAFGCAFVTAAINTPQWTQLVYDGNMSAADQVLSQETASLSNPVAVVSSLLPDVRQIDTWIEAVTSRPFLSLGYNLLFADRNRAVIVESFRNERHVREPEHRTAITNHFQYLNHGPKAPDDYLSSFRRYEYANKLISAASRESDIFQMLKPDEPQQRQMIWREGPFFTISSTVIDFLHGQVYYAGGIDESYGLFVLNKT